MIDRVFGIFAYRPWISNLSIQYDLLREYNYNNIITRTYCRLYYFYKRDPEHGFRVRIIRTYIRAVLNDFIRNTAHIYNTHTYIYILVHAHDLEGYTHIDTYIYIHTRVHVDILSFCKISLRARDAVPWESARAKRVRYIIVVYVYTRGINPACSTRYHVIPGGYIYIYAT